MLPLRSHHAFYSLQCGTSDSHSILHPPEKLENGEYPTTPVQRPAADRQGTIKKKRARGDEDAEPAQDAKPHLKTANSKYEGGLMRFGKDHQHTFDYLSTTIDYYRLPVS